MHRSFSRLFGTPKRVGTSFQTCRPIALAAGLSLGLSLVACSDSSSGGIAPGPAQTYQFRLQSLTMPTHASDFSTDLDGDGHADNAFGAIVGALTQSGLSFQTSVDASIASGQTTLLFSLTAHDTALVTDGSAQVTVYRGTASSISSAATIDGSAAPVVFTGTLSAHQFTSANPVTATQPVALSLKMPVFGTEVTIPLNGVHLQFTSATTAGSHTLVSGELQGSIKASDVNNVLLPGIAAGLNASVQADPTGSTATTILSLFDSGCTLPDVGTAHDGIISACEVANSSLIRVLFASDVSIYSSGGTYAPSISGTKNSLSFAVGFTATATTF